MLATDPEVKPCEVCDGERVVVLGVGVLADFFDCPACVGVCAERLLGIYEDDAVEACKAAGVQVRWLPSEVPC